MKESKLAKIGLFDSGIGGLTIAKAIRETNPSADMIYLSDNLNFPYGTKSDEEIIDCAKKAIETLLRKGARLVVIACNTATTVGLTKLREMFPEVDIVGVVPMIKPASQLSKTHTVGVLVTPATLKGAYYARLKADFGGDIMVIDQACPDWVEMAENGVIEREKIKRPIEHVIREGADIIVLGCTHFALLMPAIQAVTKGRAEILQPAQAVALQVERLLEKRGLSGGSGDMLILSSGSSARVLQVAQELMDARI